MIWPSLHVGPQGQSPQYRPLTCRSGRLLSSRECSLVKVLVPRTLSLRYFAMSVGASGSDLPPALHSSSSPLQSEAPIRDVQFGDFANDEIATSQGPAVVLKTELNYTSANSIDFADQRICSAPFTPTRRRSAKSDMGHGSRTTPPYKAHSTSQSPSATSPRSPKKKRA